MFLIVSVAITLPLSPSVNDTPNSPSSIVCTLSSRTSLWSPSRWTRMIRTRALP